MKCLVLKDVDENEEDNMGGTKLFMSFSSVCDIKFDLIADDILPFRPARNRTIQIQGCNVESGNTRNTLLHNGVDLCRSETALL